MDILIISNFCDDFSTVNNDRFLYIANMLSPEHDVEVVTSDYYHTGKRFREPLTNKDGIKITMLHESGYPKNVCLKRFFSHFVWGRNVKKYLTKRKHPDVVYCAVPSLTAACVASKFCNKHNIKFVIDIQDLWPEAFQMVFNIPILSQLIFLPFTFKANLIYKKADVICAVSDTYSTRALKVNSKCKNGISVFLGTELSSFDFNASKTPIIHKEGNEVWLAYCGTLGSSYDLRVVFDAMHLLNIDNLRFIVMGDGPLRDEFESYAKSKHVNTIFVGRLQYDSMCSLLKKCDIAVNPITHLAAQSIINKHADYSAAGLPVLNTQENNEYRQLIEQYHMGFNCGNNNAVELAKMIKSLYEDPSLRTQMGSNSRKCAEEKFDRKITYKQLIEVITQ